MQSGFFPGCTFVTAYRIIWMPFELHMRLKKIVIVKKEIQTKRNIVEKTKRI